MHMRRLFTCRTSPAYRDEWCIVYITSRAPVIHAIHAWALFLHQKARVKRTHSMVKVYMDLVGLLRFLDV